MRHFTRLFQSRKLVEVIHSVKLSIVYVETMEANENGSTAMDASPADFLPMDSVEGIQEFVTGESQQQNIKIKDEGYGVTATAQVMTLF